MMGDDAMKTTRLASVAVLLLVAGLGCSQSTQAPVVAQADCSGDSQCAARGGGVCVQGVCQQCRTDGDCGGGARCASNRCESAPVVTAIDTASPVVVQPTVGSRCYESVYFEFDDSSLSEAARGALQQTADCIRREAGPRFVLIGHADPRGATEYNLALGHRRAHGVLQYLVSLGVPRARLAASSVGSEQASGSDEVGWARDRHVAFDRPGDR